MLIRNWMTPNPVTVSPKDTLARARQKMDQGGFRRLPVTDRGRLVGMITDRDLRQQTGQLEHTLVEAVMTSPVTVANADMLLDQAAGLFVGKRVGGFPVVDGDRLVGIITSIDMMRAFADVLGTAEEGVSRIDLAFTGNSFDLAMIAQLAGQANGEVLGMGTYEGAGDTGDRAFYLRVRTADARKIARMLSDNGFSVVAIHQ
jgi:acetoin utilization protein AcuB